MTGIFKEIDCFGIYVSPFFGCLLLAAAVTLVLHRWMDHIEIQRYVWNRPLFDTAVFLILLSITVYLL